MGTTESIFATDPEEIPTSLPGSSRQQHHEPIPTIPDNNNQNHSRRTIIPPTDERQQAQQHRHRRPRNSNPSISNSPNPQPPLHDKSKPSDVSQQPVNHHFSRSESTSFQLNGIVSGLSKSGKRTLLQRLEGKEPNFDIHHKSSSNNHTHDETDVTTVVNAPYQPSHHLPKFDDEMIQLQVQAMKKIIRHHRDNEKDRNDSLRHGDYHFFIIIINPRHDRIKVQKYIIKRLHDILHLQGYTRIIDKKKNDLNTTSSTSTSQGRPICISILRNFADRIQADISSDSIIQSSELTLWTMEVLEEYSYLDTNNSVTVPLLQCIDTSLLNCYGLSALHHFIYQSYVQFKQYSIQQELVRIENAITISRHEATSFIIPYNEYIENIERLLLLQGSTTASTSTTLPSSNNSAGSSLVHSTTTNSMTKPNRRRIITSPAGLPPSSHLNSHRRDESNALEQRPPRSRTMSGDTSTSTLPSIQQSLDHAKDALEAFLESDSDDEDKETEDVVDTTKGHDSLDHDSEDDDDDGFYVEETNDDTNAEIIKSSDDAEQTLPIESLAINSHINHVEETVPSIINSSPIDRVDEIVKENLEDRLASDDIKVSQIQTNHESAELDITARTAQIGEKAGNLHAVEDHGVSTISSKTVDHEGEDEDSDFFIEEDVIENNVEVNEASKTRTLQDADIATDVPTDSVISVESEIISASESHPDKYISSSIDMSTDKTDVSDVAQNSIVNNAESAVECFLPKTNSTATPIVEDEHISDAVRAALELARKDFERMMLVEHRRDEDEQIKEIVKNTLPKKSKKDKQKKKSSTKEVKKSKRNDLEKLNS